MPLIPCQAAGCRVAQCWWCEPGAAGHLVEQQQGAGHTQPHTLCIGGHYTGSNTGEEHLFLLSP